MDNPPTVIITTPQPPSPQPFFPSSPPYPHPENTTTVSSPPAPLPFTSSSSPQTQIYPITIVTLNQPPPFPDSPRTVDLSPLVFIFALMAVIAIPALIYVFFFAVKCPPWSSSSSTSSERHTHGDDDDNHSRIELPVTESTVPVSGLKYKKETHSKEIGNECPVCLSVFTDGEEVKLLSLCKHSFHTICIDLWLTNNNNCPICRAEVDVNRRNNNRGPSSGSTRDGGDHHQGLPDASSLV